MAVSKIHYMLEICSTIAKMSKDPNTQVGCIIVKDGRILSSGYNGYIAGANDEALPSTSPEKAPYFIHAELNAVLNAAKEGISLSGAEIYCTHSPCPNCVRHMWQAGIKKFFVNDMHHTSQNYSDMKDIYVQSFKKNGYFEIYTEAR